MSLSHLFLRKVFLTGNIIGAQTSKTLAIIERKIKINSLICGIYIKKQMNT